MKTVSYHDGQLHRRARVLSATLLLTILFSGIMALFFFQLYEAQAAGVLDVEIVAAYNLVVDSNVLSPSTYAPSVATVLGRVCNTGDASLTGVQIYIGNYDTVTPANSTPGQYPQRTKAAIMADHPALHAATANGTAYYFEHVGGRIGLNDATRFIGTLAAGQCANQYWHFAYPRRSNLAADNDNLGSVPTWGDSVKPGDDLWLQFDIWADDNAGSTSDDEIWTMTMRNEISAMANKIEPNPNGHWFNTDGDSVLPGQVITSNGILYELGNINQGFDNDGDYVPDYNAWLQPIGDPSYDPSCFRLIRTSGVLTVSRSSGLPDLYIPFDDSVSDPLYGGPLYFTNLPTSNTGVIGKVFYTFLALDGPCSTTLTPYQEVASGRDNEKFNGDYGAGIPPVGSSNPAVTLDKSSAPATIPATGGTIDYDIAFANTSATTAAGLSLSSGGVNVPLVLSDTVPTGLQYVANSAASANTFSYCASNCVTVRFSLDSGQSWQTTDPGTVLSSGPNNLVVIQWWLNSPVPPLGSGAVHYDATVPATYIANNGNPLITNCADARFGGGLAFAEDCATNLVQGNNSLGNFVWRDLDNDAVQDGGSETGISGVTVWLYWDLDDDGVLDSADPLIATTTSNGSGIYGFSSLPDGNYLVQVDSDDTDIPTGYRLTTRETYAIPLDPTSTNPAAVTNETADFGFGPSLSLSKQLSGTDPLYEGDLVTYTINVTNNRPGDSSGTPQVCTYDTWASLQSPYSGTGQKAWLNPANSLNAPDSTYATAPYAAASENLGGYGWGLSAQTGTPTSVLVRIPYQKVGTFGANDQFQVRLIDCGTTTPACEPGGNETGAPGGDDTLVGLLRTFNVATDLPGTSGTLVIDVSADRAWSWSDFTGNRITIQMITNKDNTNGARDLNVDSVGFRVSSGLTCNVPDDVMNPVPLTDIFDNTKFQFVSASPPESSVSGGTITWNNVGPINPGQSRTVTVVFRVLEPPGNNPTTHQNCADSSGGIFANGEATNDPAQSCVTNNVNPTGSIGDRVWNDADGDGIQDAGETGIPYVTLHLCGPAATPSNPCTTASPDYLASTTTSDGSDGNPIGYYLFDALRDGNYRVNVDTTTVPGFGASTTQTGDPDQPGVACTVCDNSGAATIAAANDVTTVDFGYRLTRGVIYGSTWEDLDTDGVKDAGEQPISGVTVYLCSTTPCNGGSAITSDTTDASGHYLFDNLLAGTYYTAVNSGSLPAGTTWTQSGDPDQTGTNCSPLCDNEWTTGVPLAAGQIYGSVDYGYHGSYTIGNTIYVDWNGDGDQDSAEEGISGVDVRLYEITNCGAGTCTDGDETLSSSPIAGDTTDLSGHYLFTNLPAGNYRVIVDSGDIPASHAQTQDPDEGGVCATCDGQGTATVNAGNPDELDEDFGYQPTGTGSIGDRVWQDEDGDAIQDSGESGLANITVNLYHDLNNNNVYDAGVDALIATTTTSDGTDGNPVGYYLFTGLPADNYLLDVDTNDADLPTLGGQPYGLSTNNDPHQVDLASGQTYLLADFGFYPAGIIGDYVWQDDNGDGEQGENETGINGVTLQLYDCGADTNSDDNVCGDADDVLLDTTTTANDGLGNPGYYQFTGLEAGYYEVRVTSGVPAGYTQTGDPDAYTPSPPCTGADGPAGAGTGCDNESTEIRLNVGQVDLSNDFGYRPPIFMGDTVWINPDGDSVQDPGEPGIPYVTVRVYRDGPNNQCDGGAGDDVLVATTETDSQGHYAFAGSTTTFTDDGYCIVVDNTDLDFPSGTVQNYDPDGINNNQTRVVVSGGAVTSVGNNNCPNCELTADFGYRYNGTNSLSGTVFYDGLNNGGLYDSGINDTPFQGVPVYLYNCETGTCNDGDETLVSSTTTAANGSYSFTTLPNGTYLVAVDQNNSQLLGLGQTREPNQDPCSASPSNCNNNNQVTLSGGADSTGNDYGFYGTLDCGDLPDNDTLSAAYFSTLKIDNGACHQIGALRLGATIDAESDGQPDTDAGTVSGGDGSDENGITRASGTPWTPGSTVNLSVVVTGSNGYLVGWFDWDGDGDFSRPDERVIFGSIGSGTQTRSLTIPNYYTTGQNLFARFRLYDASGGTPTFTSPTGIVGNGEVEDYLWQFAPTAVTLRTATAGPQDAAQRWTPLLTIVGLLATSIYIFKRRRIA